MFVTLVKMWRKGSPLGPSTSQNTVLCPSLPPPFKTFAGFWAYWGVPETPVLGRVKQDPDLLSSSDLLDYRVRPPAR